MKSFKNNSITKIFNSYSPAIKSNLLLIRQCIFDVASENEEIGELEETLKWEQPSYLTSNPKSGTTIRLAAIDSKLETKSTEFGIYVHCQTTLIAEFKEMYPELKYDGNRAIVFNSSKKLPIKKIKYFIYLALSYHHRKNLGIGI